MTRKTQNLLLGHNMRMIAVCFLVLWIGVTARGDEGSKDAVSAVPKDISGAWSTDYGELNLTQEGGKVTGTYAMGRVDGKLDGNVLKLHYAERADKGEAAFTFSSDGSSFEGKWRADGTSKWLPWNGKRHSLSSQFNGLWKTSFGLMRLVVDGEKIRGAYDHAGGEAKMEGEVKNGRFAFRYQEPEAAGEGWFKISNDGRSIDGKWRQEGRQAWSPWTGTKVIPVPGRVWLVILEANWERSIAEQEYAFGDMLESYFTMSTARHVEVRHRFFHDATDLQRFCRKVQFLPGPAVVLISTHGSPEGITVFGQTIKANVVADSLKGASNLQLLHLSGCAMMKGEFPNQIHEALRDRNAFPISGYKTIVAWDASALGDFTFLSLLLVRGLEPKEAVRKAIVAAPYLGDVVVPETPFAPLGLTVVDPPMKR